MRTFLCAVALLCFAAYSKGQSISPAGPVNFCVSGTLSVTGVTGTPTYQWQEGGTNIPGATGPTLNVTASGNYTVILGGTPPDTLSAVAVTVSPNPVAAFTFLPNNQCSNVPITFSNTSSGTGLSYSWDFGDPASGANNTSSALNPVHEFIGTTGVGNQSFTVTLTVTSSAGCTNSTTRTVTTVRVPSTTLAGTGQTIYNGVTYFTHCSNTSALFTFANQSTTTGTNTNYQIVWGDASPDYTSTGFVSESHTYAPGNYPLLFIVTGSNGCKDTGYYRVFVGTNPAIAFGNPGSTSICSGTPLTFPISSFELNPPSTIYTVTFTDGTAPIVFSHPPPSSVSHLFTTSSCGFSTGTHNNSFSASIEASNPCLNSVVNIVPIYVTSKPVASFTISPNDTVCTNTNVLLTNTSPANSNNNNGTCQPGKFVWSITPATGWTLLSGSLGMEITGDPALWVSGTANVGINFTLPGKYSIKLKTGNNIACGLDSMVREICVNPLPTGSFNLSNNAGCAPLLVNTTSTTNTPLCGSNTFQWSVTYTPTTGCVPSVSGFSYLNGTNSSSSEPQFQFNNPGIYTVGLWIISPASSCSTQVSSQQVTVRSRPIVTLGTLPSEICQGQTISPSASSTCYINGSTTYLWSFPGGTPATSNSPAPGIITYNTPGNQTISLSVTNECGTTTVSHQILIKPTPEITSLTNNGVCAGETAGPFPLTSNPAAANITWANNNVSIGLAANGTGNSIPSFTATNASASPITATITTTATLNGCSSSSSFTITVNPRPPGPVVSPVSYCQGAVAVPLTAIASAGHTLNWYLSSVGGSPNTTAPTPSTTNTGIITYFVSQVSTTTQCESVRIPIVVTVHPSPLISGSSFINPTQCGASNGSISLTGLSSNTTYTVNYVQGGNPVSVTLSSNAAGTIIINNLPAGIYTDIHVSANNCPSPAIAAITLQDPSAPATPVANSNSPLCSGQTLNLSALTSSGAATYTWSGPGGFLSSQQNPTIPNVTTAASGTYNVTATINGCTSAAASVTITINQTPALPVITSNAPICSGETLTLNTSSTVSPVTYAWNGPGGFTSTLQNPEILNAATSASGTYSVVITATTGSCSSQTGSLAVVVKPTPVITSGIPTNPTLCNSATGSIVLHGLTSGNSYTVNYTENGTPETIVLIATAPGIVTIPNLTSGTYDNIHVVLNNCPSNNVGPFTLVDPNPPVAPTATSPAEICSGNTLTLNGTNNAGGTATFNWSGPGGFSSNQQNPSITNITTAATGTYTLTVTVNGCTSPPATTTVVVNQSPATPTVGSNTPVCSGETINLTGSTTLPGTINYSWTGPGGYTSNDQNPVINSATIANSGMYTLIATAVTGNCPSSPASTNVVVNPTPVITTSTGSNPTQCNTPTGSITLTGLGNNITYNVHYEFNTSPVVISITSNGSGSLTIPSLTAGSYTNIFVESLGCQSNNANAHTLIDPNPPAAPDAGSTSPVCSGQTLNLNASTSEPGTATYTWSGPDGFGSTLQNPVIVNTTAASAGNYLVTVTINNCTSPASIVPVVINPLASLPGVVSPVQYCINAPSVALTATPQPGNPLTWYTQSIGGTGTSIAPIPSTTVAGTTSYYVSQTTAFGCEGPRDTIHVVINPDAIAQINPAVTISCPPFLIDTDVINLQHFPANNGTYEWYVDDIMVGTGLTFPGHTIPGENSSVTIKVKAISLFGCKADSVSQVFQTYNLPHPSFELIDTVGCGPLTVQVVNTTPNIGLFTYYWDFGNGQTSTAANPGDVIFLPNPTFKDTIYEVSLQIFSICDTITVVKTVRVKSKPKALFTPDRTVGCSPMTINFQNTSLGLNSTYYWDFGDGTTTVTNTLANVQHTYNTGIQDTFPVKLVAVNECGSDSITYDIIVAPNNILLNFSVNGPETFGCAPHTVAFINNTSGATTFHWNFGDGNTLNTVDNIDTVYHTFLSPGNYTVTLTAANSCTDTTTNQLIQVFAKPLAEFEASNYTECQGNTITFTNQSTGATSYLWNFGDGNTSTLFSPTHAYSTPGLYNVTLTAYHTNAPGNVCAETIMHPVQIVSTLPGSFTMSAIGGDCAPLTVTFANQTLPSVSATWDFGDGNTATGNNVTHTYTLPGIYQVTLTVIVPGTCTYISTQTVTLSGPSGTMQYAGGYNCSPDAVRFEATAANFNSLEWNFGDGNIITTTQLVVFHTYDNPGTYYPSLKIKNNAGCEFPVAGVDPIRVDKIDGGFTATQQLSCGSTTISFNDTSHVFFGVAQVLWNFGDGNTGMGANPVHQYQMSGLYPVEMIVISNSGCTDTIKRSITVQVNTVPVISISAPASACNGEALTFAGNVQSTDPLNIQQWNISNGASATGPFFNYSFTNPGTYEVRFIAGTVAGCYDTAYHTITVRQSPTVNATANMNICLGTSVQLNASGALQYQWSPLAGLSCSDCANPIATPVITTPYVVTGTNAEGCTDEAQVIVTVVQPLNMNVSTNDSICIGESSFLNASGALTYQWTPSSTLNDDTAPNPVATPTVTTTYRVVGYDGFNCFTDTAFVVVAVGQYPTVDLGPDVLLSAGTIHPLNTTISNGPIKNWLWTPSTDLNCNTCPLPTATVKKDISYVVRVENIYGCAASDTIRIQVFCEETQVFIPNAFTPDGDGVNDILMVRGKGIVSVKSFRIFNRWGEVVFEKNNFPPNNPLYGWNGKIKGVEGPPDVFVYTAEVLCENGTPFIYKGNVSIIK